MTQSDVSVKLDGNEIWEWLYGDLRGNVPDALTDDVLNRLAAHIRDHFPSLAAQPPDDVREAWNGPYKTAGEALDGLRRTVAELLGEDPETWPKHKNAGLAIAATLAIKMREVNDLLDASPTPPDDVAEGMVVVPREPTEAMIDAAMGPWASLYPTFPGEKNLPKNGDVAATIYRAMIAAAPASHPEGVRDADRERGSDWNGDRDPRSGSDLE